MIPKSLSKIFISTEKFEYDFFNLNQIKDMQDRDEQVYALAYHNGFKKFNYDKLLIKETSLNKKIYSLKFSNPVGRIYNVYLSNEEEIFTINKGYINVTDANVTDVYYDHEGNYCKLLKKSVTDNLSENEVYYNINVVHHKSFFLNGILVRNIDN